MRIGIDGFSLTRNDSGIEVYTRELVNGLLQFNEVELYTYAEARINSHANLRIRNSGLQNATTIAKLHWQLTGVTELISDVDVYHCPHFILPMKKMKCKTVVTVHDLAFIKLPQFFDWKTKLYYKLLLNQSLEKTDSIICISKSCQDDLREFFPAVAGKSALIHNGFRDFSKIPPDNQILERLSIKKKYLMLIGTLNPRKNIEGAIRAFETVSKKHDLDLVIVGDLGRTKLHLANKNPRIHFSGYVNDAELSALYRNSTLLLFPSFYEGFGFPILEAMSVGIPVVTSNVSSMPEISAYPKERLCDPASVESIVTTTEKMLLERDAWKAHGLANVRSFTWNKMVSLTNEVYAGL